MITVNHYNQTRQLIETKAYAKLVTSVLSKYGITDNVEVELRFVGRVAMRRLNHQHRLQDRSTDVLSFPVWPNLTAIRSQPGQILLGSVVICLPVVISEATKEKQTIETKIAFLIEHSLLHLIGIHHKGD